MRTGDYRRGLLVAAGCALVSAVAGCGGGSRPTAGTPTAKTTPATEARSTRWAGVRDGEAGAIETLSNAFPVIEPAQRKAVTAAEAPERIALLGDLRHGYARTNSGGKALLVLVGRRVMDRFAVEGTPAGWQALLGPTHDLFTAALQDRDPGVRGVALENVGALWTWSPGCSMTSAEEAALGSWKEQLYPLVVARLKDAEAVSRMAAVGSLGLLPINTKAEPAVHAVTDKEVSVRFQVLRSFASRPDVLTNEAILPLLQDPVRDMSSLAEKVLAARGLNADLIGLARMATHPRPEMRRSAIAQLLRRDDIDPVVWLLRLSEDADETVRLEAVKAFEGRITPEVRQRLRELAAADDSEAVRAAAAKLAPADNTAALPPLPGSPSLRPRAN